MHELIGPYRDLVGSLLWVAQNTRPDLAHAVGMLCRFSANPGVQHWTAAKQVLRYLSTTRNMGILYEKTEKDALHVYSDADLANCQDTRRSVTGHVTLLANGAIGWKSKLQKGGPATSSVVAEYQALYDATRSTVWFRQLVKEMGFQVAGPVDIYEDNQGCLAMANNHRTDALTKHIDVKYH